MCPGHKTYFIEGRQLSSPYDHEHCLTPSNPVNLRLIISPAAFPQSVLSFTPTPLPHSLTRKILIRMSRRRRATTFCRRHRFIFVLKLVHCLAYWTLMQSWTRKERKVFLREQTVRLKVLLP